MPVSITTMRALRPACFSCDPQMDATQYANTYEADNGSQWTGCREGKMTITNV